MKSANKQTHTNEQANEKNKLEQDMMKQSNKSQKKQKKKRKE